MQSVIVTVSCVLSIFLSVMVPTPSIASDSAISAVPPARAGAQTNSANAAGEGVSIGNSVLEKTFSGVESAGRSAASASIRQGDMGAASTQLHQSKTLGKAGGIVGHALNVVEVGARCFGGQDNCQGAIGQKGLEIGFEAAEAAAIRGYAISRGGAAVLSSGAAGFAILGAGIAGDVAGTYLNENLKYNETANRWLQGRKINDALTDDAYFPAYEGALNWIKYGSTDGLLDDDLIEEAKAKGRARKEARLLAREREFNILQSANVEAAERRRMEMEAARNASSGGSSGADGFLEGIMGAVTLGLVLEQQNDVAASSPAPQSSTDVYDGDPWSDEVWSCGGPVCRGGHLQNEHKSTPVVPCDPGDRCCMMNSSNGNSIC